jgi:hypothetical protein
VDDIRETLNKLIQVGKSLVTFASLNGSINANGLSVGGKLHALETNEWPAEPPGIRERIKRIESLYRNSVRAFFSYYRTTYFNALTAFFVRATKGCFLLLFFFTRIGDGHGLATLCAHMLLEADVPIIRDYVSR